MQEMVLFLLKFVSSADPSCLMVSCDFDAALLEHAELPAFSFSIPCFASVVDGAIYPRLSEAMTPSQTHSTAPVPFLVHFV